ncbi:MAG: arginine N-succinyltransferase [Rickettsiales bacterium]
MIVVRPVEKQDHKEILALAKKAGIGMTSLPPDKDVLEAKIAHSVASIKKRKSAKGHEAFLFVLEDVKKKKLVGTCGIAAHVGMRHPFYSYKLSTIVQANSTLGVYSMQRVLHMVNDYTGASEIGSLFLLPSHRRGGNGKFLSRCRYLFMAEFPDVFSDIVIAEMRGVQDDDGHSPFYKNLAQHFFKMDFKKADFVNATQGGQFISDLMPKYPIYVNLLDPRAQAAIGRPFHASRPALQLLEREGFTNEGYVDVFDAGPTVQAERTKIRTVRKSRRVPLVRIAGEVPEKPTYMISNSKYEGFRATLSGLQEIQTGVVLSKETAKLLNVKAGDMVRYIEA